MMDITNDWFGTINYSSIDHQQQTYVTKHDLELLHKKIIATDLIVQKYQDANKALLRLQTENDHLKEQIEQITNECCIFGKQVTECTQECDNLKEQIGLLNIEKLELRQQLRILQDENTNNHHEIMVLKQFESLKEINDQLTKTADRQQKQVAKLQLQVQRKSFSGDKSKQDPSETDIALTKSKKSVLELKLALGRLVNFIQNSKIEIPSNLYIRPVLKAHEINDDFLEAEGEFVLKPVIKVLKPVVSQTIEDEEDDDEDDFIDVTHPVDPSSVNTTAPSVDVVEETPTTSKSSRQQKKKKESPKTKPKKKPSIKTRRKKDQSLLEESPTKLDELANELEIAVLQPNQQESISQLSSFLSDDDDNEDKTQKSDKQHVPTLKFAPLILQQPTIQSKTQSSISFTPRPIDKQISFFSDDDNEEIAQQKSTSSRTKQQSQVANDPSMVSLQVDNIIPMAYEPLLTPTKYMSTLSEDDDDNNRSVQQFTSQEYSSPIKLIEPTFKKPIDDSYTSPMSDRSPSIASPILTTETFQSSIEHSLLNKQKEVNVQDSALYEKDQTRSSIPVNTLQSNHIDIVLRLLNVVTQVPTSLKPLRSFRRRSHKKKICNEPIIVPIQHTTTTEIPEHITPVKVQLNFIEEVIATAADSPLESLIVPVKERSQSIEITDKIVQDYVTEPMEVHSKLIEEINTTVVDILEIPLSNQIEEQAKAIEEFNTVVHTPSQTSLPVPEEEEQLKATEENVTVINETVEKQMSTPEKSQPKLMEKRQRIRKSDPIISEVNQQQQQNPIEDGELTSSNDSESGGPFSRLKESPAPSRTQKSKSLAKQIPVPPLVFNKQSLLNPFKIAIISRLLNTLTTLPVKPLNLRIPLRSPKRKRTTITRTPSITHSRQPSNQLSRSPTRMQTRSLNSIRACIARCNQPKPTTTTTRKRTATELISPPATTPKRMKPTKPEQIHNEYESINKFINLFSKEINDELSKLIEKKLHDDVGLFNDNIYRIFSEFMMTKCDIILPLVKHLHPYEESIRILLTYINSKSSVFHQHFLTKLNQSFESEIKQARIIEKRIKILNRLFFLTCSISSLSSVVIYARLFDIGYYLSDDILSDALIFISNLSSSLLSIDSQTNSSNILLHQILFDFQKEKKFNISFEYLENLLIAYQRYTYDREDLVRSFILISRYQSWSWCSNELCSKIFFPLLTKIDDQYQQREVILILLQYILFIYKDNEDFKRDINFHEHIKQRFQSLKTMNSHECVVRDKILSILHTC